MDASHRAGLGIFTIVLLAMCVVFIIGAIALGVMFGASHLP